jgi:hypothetical protein
MAQWQSMRARAHPFPRRPILISRPQTAAARELLGQDVGKAWNRGNRLWNSCQTGMNKDYPALFGILNFAGKHRKKRISLGISLLITAIILHKL